MVDLGSPKGGLEPSTLTTPDPDQSKNYTRSKVGNWFLASEMSRHLRTLGILSLSQNPGNLKTNLLRHTPAYFRWITSPLIHKAKMGAYTELWAGLLPDLTLEANSGGFILLWGR
ncbi:MAG: hypothetical protein Q9170_007350, partial [Blastenia crenularia]